MLPAGSPLSDWLIWLETLSPKEIDLGLDRVQSVLERLSIEIPANVLLIAGTNGKGSSVAMTEALLCAAGYRVGAYTSPHIMHYNERIAVDRVPASDEQIIAAFERIAASRHDVPLTYFEYGTLAAMVVFSEQELDAWVLEVGMGGRLDASNAIDPTASLITNVALDHCDWLGDDVEAIAFEKAGVMRKGVPTVFGSREVPNSVLRHAEATGAELLLLGRDFDFELGADRDWSFAGRDLKMSPLELPGLTGAFQVQNAAAVLALIEAAGLTRALQAGLLRQVLPNLKLTGRWQAVRAAGADWLLDVAHNPAAAKVLSESLAATRGVGKTWAITGLLDDKDVEGVAAALNPEVDYWIAVTANSPRAIQADELARRIANRTGRPCRVSDSLDEAMQYAARSASENDRILLTGSFYLVGPALLKLELYSRPES
ncbi:MAG: bifunctional folylpolyglutamate synthase/dihydrofolate synthase [Gammaproteobacteria bacterium]|nr:bifunctional folylpolyglutamate synthase/dihydrofolate synthase [Gammaproteobacteria bacterium]MBT8111473.1 bifunctional folylpolyglutamate synthase/dihydrofolate synthase [Gammaproteobacteria bacterium]NND46646.1 bifunctional folylpolyglutamate synthase/dihydrofolate synthase [Woeseiaceae bacterium]NNL46171.1 bifunctional folylpolyglutamate synthase/dihydrofolate synthase [Woeseiaceae bacterium]